MDNFTFTQVPRPGTYISVTLGGGNMKTKKQPVNKDGKELVTSSSATNILQETFKHDKK